jgi:hypothetical protein
MLPPVGPGHQVARGLDLGERGQKVRRDDGRGVLVEERFVLPPRSGGDVESVPLTEDELGRLG